MQDDFYNKPAVGDTDQEDRADNERGGAKQATEGNLGVAKVRFRHGVHGANQEHDAQIHDYSVHPNQKGYKDQADLIHAILDKHSKMGGPQQHEKNKVHLNRTFKMTAKRAKLVDEVNSIWNQQNAVPDKGRQEK
jgi:hypothetical protein